MTHPDRTSRDHGSTTTAGAVLLSFGIAISLATSVHADWNTGVGGNSARDCRATVAGPAAEIIRWQGSRPSLVAQQAIVDGNLLVVNRIGSFTIPTGTWIVAHDIVTGAEEWAIQLPYDFPGTSWRSRASAMRDDRVYATRSGNGNEDYLYALDPADGSILWQSEDLIDEGTTESLAFAPDGDLIAGDFFSLIRIENTDGTTVWEVPRSCPTGGGCQTAIFGDRIYLWEASGNGPVVTAFVLSTGQRLYSSDAIGAGFIEQVGLMCGPDGTVYAPRSQNNPATDFFTALQDTGTEFVEKWDTPMGYTPFASFGVGPDGSVYTYSRQLEVLRLDPTTGDVLDRSFPLPSDIVFSARMAVGADGRVFVTNGGFDTGAFFAFTPDLQPIWSTEIENVNLGGPTIADDGTLVVCGIGTDVRAYRTVGVDVADGGFGVQGPLLRANVPNPFRRATDVRFELVGPARVTLQVFDVRGRRVQDLLLGEARSRGVHTVSWDGRTWSGTEALPGVYHTRLIANGVHQSRRVVLTR